MQERVNQNAVGHQNRRPLPIKYERAELLHQIQYLRV